MTAILFGDGDLQILSILFSEKDMMVRHHKFVRLAACTTYCDVTQLNHLPPNLDFFYPLRMFPVTAEFSDRTN